MTNKCIPERNLLDETSIRLAPLQAFLHTDMLPWSFKPSDQMTRHSIPWNFVQTCQDECQDVNLCLWCEYAHCIYGGNSQLSAIQDPQFWTTYESWTGPNRQQNVRDDEVENQKKLLTAVYFWIFCTPNLCQEFLVQLNVSQPHWNFAIGSQSHSITTADNLNQSKVTSQPSELKANPPHQVTTTSKQFSLRHCQGRTLLHSLYKYISSSSYILQQTWNWFEHIQTREAGNRVGARVSAINEKCLRTMKFMQTQGEGA